MDIFIGTISAFGFNYAPYGWAFCQGQILPIGQNTALFALLGTYYGGNGTSTFGLPDLGGRVAISQGTNGQSTYNIGETDGANTVTLVSSNLPAHTHGVSVTLTSNDRDPSNSSSPVNNFPGIATDSTAGNYNDAPSGNVFMKSPSITLGTTGGNSPISIQDPVLVMNYSIATQGSFPPRN